MVLIGETDQERMEEFWPPSLWPACQLLGCPLVWSIGLESLGYPPTWAHTQKEADIVESGIQKHFSGVG